MAATTSQAQTLRERASAAVHAAQGAAKSKGAAVADFAKGAKTASLNRCASLKTSIMSAWADFSEKGARLFFADTLKTARGLVQEYAMLGRTEVAGRYQEVATLTVLRYADARTKVVETSHCAKEQATAAYETVSARTVEAVEVTKAKGQVLRSSVAETVVDRRFQATAGSAAGGAVVGGVSGGAVGLTTGTAVGAVVGFIPALFTFGLSIPIGAAVGGGAGLFLGTAVGVTTGAVGGGVAGRAVYDRTDSIAGGASSCAEYVRGKAGAVKGQACASAEFVKEKASSVQVRFVGGTGGTEANCD